MDADRFAKPVTDFFRCVPAAAAFWAQANRQTTYPAAVQRFSCGGKNFRHIVITVKAGKFLGLACEKVVQIDVQDPPVCPKLAQKYRTSDAVVTWDISSRVTGQADYLSIAEQSVSRTYRCEAVHERKF